MLGERRIIHFPYKRISELYENAMDKKIYVTRSFMPQKEEFFHEIEDLWESHWLTNMGAHHEKLKKMLQEYLKVDNLVLTSSGHMALEVAIQALKLSGEVITTPFTFVSTTHALVRNGIKPIFCDVREDDFTLDADKIESLITEKTSAILPVHVYGNICDVEKIEEIARKYHLKVLYDASHTFGESYYGKSVISFGDASTYSFHATKIFHTIEGGAVWCKKDIIHECANRIINFGILDTERVTEIGLNAKMNEFEAAMGCCNLRHIEDEINHRKMVYEQYCKCLSGCKGIRVNCYREGLNPNYMYFPIIIQDDFPLNRDELCNYLARQGIYTRKYFYPLITKMDCYAGEFKDLKLPIAEWLAERVLTLPMYGGLSLDQVNKICNMICGCK